MNEETVRYIAIPVLVIIVMTFTRNVRDRIYKPKYESKVQKPGKLTKFIVNLFIVLEVIAVFFAIMGLIAGETEMAIAFSVMAAAFLIIIIVLKREYTTSYEENEEYFILKAKKNTYKVYYENIVDWQPSFNEIKVLDETSSEKKYIRVNIKLFKPEILLRKIADMAFEGKFNHVEPYREIETIHYLIDNQYGYLVEDYIQQIESN